MMDLDNKVSLVTGAGQGIGEGIAKNLASKGSKVIVVDLNQQSVSYTHLTLPTICSL